MVIDAILKEFKSGSEKSIESLQKELSRLRTGRATPAILDPVKVEYYGMPTPLKQVANISVSDARTLTITPWDKSLLGEIEKAILASGIGLTPNNDGKVIRVPIPPLTGERRKELVRQVKKIGEEYKVAVRNHRHRAIDKFKEAKDNKEITEDEYHRALKQLQQETDKQIKKIDEIISKKEEEIMEF